MIIDPNLRDMILFIFHHIHNLNSGSGGGNVTTSQLNTALADKVDKVAGKGLSTNDYTTADKTKVSTIGDKLDKGTYNGTAQNLKDAIDGKADINHSHSYNDLTNKPELFGYKGTIQKTDLNTYQDRKEGSYKVMNSTDSGFLVKFKAEGSVSSLELYKEDWTEGSHLQIRNGIDGNRNNSFKKIAFEEDSYIVIDANNVLDIHGFTAEASGKNISFENVTDITVSLNNIKGDTITKIIKKTPNKITFTGGIYLTSNEISGVGIFEVYLGNDGKVIIK